GSLHADPIPLAFRRELPWQSQIRSAQAVQLSFSLRGKDCSLQPPRPSLQPSWSRLPFPFPVRSRPTTCCCRSPSPSLRPCSTGFEIGSLRLRRPIRLHYQRRALSRVPVFS